MLKKIILIFITFLLLSNTLSACMDSENSIIGTWVDDDGYEVTYHSDGRVTDNELIDGSTQSIACSTKKMY